MKTLTYMLFLFILCQSCITGNDTQEALPEEDTTTAQSTSSLPPPVQSMDNPITIDLKQTEIDGLPQTTIVVEGLGIVHKMIENSTCNLILPKDYAQYTIPDEAEVACKCWWAGAGTDYYALAEEQTLKIYEREVFEQQIDAPTWELVDLTKVKD